DQAIVIFEQAAAGCQRDLRRYVEACFAEDRIILVLALLLGQPQGAGEAVYREQRRKIIHLVVLVDKVVLPLVEQTRDHAERLVGRGSESQLLAQLPEVIGVLNELLRILQEISRPILEI